MTKQYHHDRLTERQETKAGNEWLFSALEVKAHNHFAIDHISEGSETLEKRAKLQFADNTKQVLSIVRMRADYEEIHINIQ